jgi:hypothetical protein
MTINFSTEIGSMPLPKVCNSSAAAAAAFATPPQF